MGWGKTYSAAGREVGVDCGYLFRGDEEKGPDDGEEAVEVRGCGKSGPGFAGRRHDVLHIRLYLLRVRMLLNAWRERSGVVRHMNGG